MGRRADITSMAFLYRAFRFVFAAAAFVGVAVVAQPEQDPSVSKKNPAHTTIACTTCHQAVADIGGGIPARDPGEACRSCHKSLAADGNFIVESFHRNRSRRCNDCHSFHETSTINAAGSEFRFSARAGLGLCAACHNGAGSLAALSPGHLIAAKLVHSNNDLLKDADASTACLICHSENREVQIDGLSFEWIPQFSEQHMHPLGEIANAGVTKNGTRVRTSRDPRLHLFNNRIECQTCHQLNILTKYRLVEFESQQQLCSGCHEFED